MLRKLFKPSATLSIFTLVVIGAVIGAVAFWGGQWSLHATSTDDFCMTCHSNHSLRDEVLESAHGNNRMGIVVQCRECHLPNEPFAYLRKKIIVSKDLFRFFMIPEFNTQEWLDENRRDQADLALSYLRSIDSSTCNDCHRRVYDDPPPEGMSRMAIGMHTANKGRSPENRQTCVDCHVGIVHPYPDA